MKTPVILGAILLLSACASLPDDSVAPAAPAAPVAAPASGAAAAKPAPEKTEAKVVTTGTKRVCDNQDATGSRLKRPRCRDVPEGSEQGYRDDLLREKTDELRSYDEANTLRTSQDIFGR